MSETSIEKQEAITETITEKNRVENFTVTFNARVGAFGIAFSDIKLTNVASLDGIEPIDGDAPFRERIEKDILLCGTEDWYLALTKVAGDTSGEEYRIAGDYRVSCSAVVDMFEVELSSVEIIAA